MADIRHLIDDAFYGAESIKLDVQNRLRTKEQRAREERLLEYHNHLIDRARLITERAHRYERATLEQNLRDIKARTIALEQMEGKRLSAKPKSSPVRQKPCVRRHKGRKKRSRSLPGIHLTGGDLTGGELVVTIPAAEELPRPLTPGVDLEQNVTYKEVDVDEKTLNERYVPLNYNEEQEILGNKMQEFPQTLPPIYSQKEPTDHKIQFPTISNQNVISKPPGPDSSFQQEKDFRSLRFSTRRYITQADFISKSLDRVYDRRFSRTLSPLSKASLEKLKMAQLILGEGKDDYLEEENLPEDVDVDLESRPSVSDIKVVTGPTANVYHAEKNGLETPC